MGAGDAAPEPEPAAAAPANDGPLGQDDIDALLNDMGAGDAAPEPEPAAAAPCE